MAGIALLKGLWSERLQCEWKKSVFVPLCMLSYENFSFFFMNGKSTFEGKLVFRVFLSEPIDYGGISCLQSRGGWRVVSFLVAW